MFELDTVENKEGFFPDTKVSPDTTMPSEETKSYETQLEAIRGTVGDIVVDDAKSAVRFGNREAAKSLIMRKDLENRQAGGMQDILDSLATDMTDIVSDKLIRQAQLEANERALEQNLANAAAETLPPEIKDVVDENILETLKAKQVFNTSVGNFIQKMKLVEDEDSWLGETVDFFSTILYIEGLDRLFDGGVGGITGDVRDLLAEAKSLPPEEVEEFLENNVQGFIESVQFLRNNPQSVVDFMEAAVDGSDVALNDLRFWQAVEVIALPFEFTGAGLAANVFKGVGNKKVLADSFVGEKELFTGEASAVSSLLSVKPPFDESDSILGEVAKNIEKNKVDLEKTLDNLTSPESPDALLARVEAEFNSSYKGERILSSKMLTEGKGSVDMVVGTVKGTPFKTRGAAENFLKKADFKGEVIEHFTGGFVVKTSTNLNGLDSTVATSISWFNKNFNNMDNLISKPIVQGGRDVEGAMAQIHSAAKRVFDNSMKILTTKAGKNVNSIIQRGVDKSFWLTPKEFQKYYRRVYKTNPTAKELEAYMAFKQINDFDYEIKVKTFYKESQARGEMSYTVGDYSFNAAPRAGFNIMDGTTNKQPIHVFEELLGESGTLKKGSLNAEDMKALEETHNIVRVSPESSLFDEGISSIPTQWVAIPKRVKAKEVDPYSLVPYKAGGRRRNVSPNYIKVGRSKLAGDGSHIRVADITTHGAVSRKDAKLVASHLDEIFSRMRDVKRAKTPIESLDEFIEGLDLGRIGIATAREADEFFVKHNLYKYDDVKFEGVRDRQTVSMGDHIGGIADEMDEPRLAPMRSTMNGKRGDRLYNLDGEQTEILDPLAALMDSIDITARHSSIQGYRETALQFMEDRFGKYLQKSATNNPIDILSASLTTEAAKNKGLQKVIEAHQEYLKGILTKRTVSEDGMLSKVESLVEDVFDKGSEIRKGLHKGWSEKGTIRRGVAEAITVDPVARVKNLVFNSKLGLFNVASFIIQAATIPNVIALAGKAGLKAAQHAIPARLALMGGVDNSMREVLAKGWKVAGFKSKEDFIEYVEEFQHLGLGEIGRNLAEIGGVNGSQLGTGTLGKIASAGRAPFNQGELLSRLTAYGAARLRWMDSPKISGGKLPTSPEGRAWIRNETHRLTSGFSGGDLQLGLRGFMGIPTQFWSYPFRYVGTILGNAYTKEEKFRFLLMNTVLYGAAGIPIADYFIQDMVSKNPDLSVAEARAITNGAVDSILAAVSDGEIDSNFSARAGAGAFFTDQMRNLMEKGTLEYVSGASGSTLSGLGTTAVNVLETYALLKNPTKENYTDLTWEIIKSEISSLKNLDKTRVALETGWLYTKSGQKYAKISEAGSVAMFLGFPPQAYEDITVSFLNEERRKDKIKEQVARYFSLESKIDKAKIEGASEEYIQGLRSAISALSDENWEYGIAGEVNKRVLQESSSKGMLDRRVREMFKHSHKSKPGLGVDFQQVNKEKDKE